MDFSYWRDKRVLVTGADGFIGSHLTEKLVGLGAKVRAFVYYNSFADWGWLKEFSSEDINKLDIFPGDIRDSNRVEESLVDIEYVFHLSSLIAIPYSYHAPESYVQTNITGALNVLNAAKKQKTKRVIHTSTSEVYGSALYVPIDEKHPLQGQSPYSASKIGADVLAESFYKSFDLPIVIARPFNTYGPRQSARAIIPTILSQLHQGAQTLQVGSLHPTRDFSYVGDTVNGFLSLGMCEKAIGEFVNIGNGKEISIKDLIDLLVKVSGKHASVISEEERIRPEKSEVNRLLSDTKKIKELTGWAPEYSLKEGLEKTSEWIKDNLNYSKPSVYNI